MQKNQLLFLFNIIVFRVVLDLAYVYLVSPIFSYQGLTLNINHVKMIESYVLTALLALPVRHKIFKPSDFLICILFAFVVIPTLSFYALASRERLFLYYMLTGYLLVISVNKFLPILSVKLCLKEGRTIALLMAGASVFCVLGLMVIRGGLNYFNLNLLRVYDFRRAVGEVINFGLLGYLNTWAFKVFNPFMIAFSMLTRKWLAFGIFVSVQVLFFGISNHKSVLFYPLLIIAVYYLFSHLSYKKILSLMMSGLSALVVICSFVAIYFKKVVLVSLFVRRLFYVPALLNFTYYELFEKLGHVYLSNSILSRLIKYPFQYGYTHMVSLYLYGSPEVNCNNGFLATSYMHFGFAGVVIFSITVGLLMRLVDSLVSTKLPMWFVVAATIVPFFSLFTSADLSTALLTHGIGVSLILLWLVR